MATLGEAVEDAVPSDKSQQRMNPDSGQLDSQSSQEESNHSALPEKELGEFQKRESPNPEFSAPQCNEEGSTLSIKTDKVLDNVQQRQSSDINSGDHTSQSSQEGTPLSAISVSSTHNQRQSHDYASGDHMSEASQAGTSLSLIPGKELDNLEQGQISDTGAHASQSNQEGSSLSTIPEKVQKSVQLTQSINTGSHLLQRDQEGRTPSRVPDKASEDGYNWRKYGQKLVKGNEFIRSYYRCTYPNCPAKRQVERSQDGQITDTIYLGNHEHPKPQPSPHIAVCSVLPIRVKRPEETFLAVQEDKSSNTEVPTSHNAEPTQTPQLPTIAPSDDAVEGAVSPSSRARDAIKYGGDSNSKRQKKDICNIDESPTEKPHGEPKVVVQTTSEVDIVNDGFRWRKYGQKLVKGNPNPRSYYRCSKAGCPAKKHVERASHDPKVVITTYEGQHDHDRPPARTVTHNTAGANTTITALNGESKSRPDEGSAVGLDMAVHISAN